MPDNEYIPDPMTEIEYLRADLAAQKTRIAYLENQVANLNVAIVRLIGDIRRAE